MTVKAESFKSERYIKGSLGLSIHERWPDFSSPLHWHDYIEVELVLDGKGRQTLNGEEDILTAGCLTVMRPTDFHDVSPDEGFHLINLSINDRLLPEEIISGLSTGKRLFFRLSPADTATVASLLGLLHAESEAADPDRRYIKHLILSLFLKILKFIPLPDEKENEISGPVQSAVLYLQMHFREDPTLGEVASICHYNPNHFSTVFHREMGMTYSEYLNRLKIAYAKELLLTTDAKITDICFESGFTSHSNFLRLFKKDTGISPIRFRTK